MKHTNMYHAWTDPDGDMAKAYCHLSYLLFRTDSEAAEIVAARCPDMVTFSAGRGLIDALGLDEEARAYVFSAGEYEAPLVVMTDVGLGVLDKRYDAHAGLGIYWHLHGRPDGLARLLCGGVLGNADRGRYRISRRVMEAAGSETSALTAEDLPSYRALLDGWPILAGEVPGAWAKSDLDGCMGAEGLGRMVEELAEFAGCGLVREAFGDDGGAERLRCPRPALLEILLLGLLTEARNESATREAVCRIGTIEETGMLTMELRYPVEDTSGSRRDKNRGEAVLAGLHRHLGWVCELNGLKLQSETLPRSHGKGFDEAYLTERRITLEWLHDPAVLSTSDLKAKIRFLYESEDR